MIIIRKKNGQMSKGNTGERGEELVLCVSYSFWQHEIERKLIVGFVYFSKREKNRLHYLVEEVAASDRNRRGRGRGRARGRGRGAPLI